ncbi:hypothetical protein GPECTOR_16g581 [Gonium pectorale]|uniref:FAST kinase leucine-rich domain-containing protein n=1 Tax=Gonium pectorale TaxID=33097 RepID=A0A150GKV0_GONPE|nr:hypothetical protein GPECTOR_16g581 [Gonium pectorale]|eukprot:KXZ50408.1 hypothetical protein GPECTOR_16g581 [Gonium pectorale]
MYITFLAGKMSYDLASVEPLGPYLAKELEDRIMALTERDGLKDPRNAEQLWFGLGHVRYTWDSTVLRSLFSRTLQDMGTWDDLKSLTQTCERIAILAERYGIKLHQKQRERITEVMLAAVPVADPADLAIAVEGLTFTAKKLGLSLPPAAIKYLHNCVLTMPQRQGRQRATTALAHTLYDITRLGYQPTAAEAAAWAQRLLDTLPQNGGASSQDDQSWVFLALSSCRNYTPAPDMKVRLKALAEGLPRGCSPGIASRTLIACNNWGVTLGPGVAESLQGRYKR